MNMFGLRFTTDAQARAKNGAPPQSTTGVASTSWSQARRRGETACWSGWPGIRSDMAIARSGTVRASPTQSRRVMSRSSGFTSSASVTIRGSSAMPQIGQAPGPGRTISGCIGQTHSVRVGGASTVTGSSAMPHMGHGLGAGLADLGVHGARVATGRRADGRSGRVSLEARALGQVSLGVGAESLETAGSHLRILSQVSRV